MLENIDIRMESKISSKEHLQVIKTVVSKVKTREILTKTMDERQKKITLHHESILKCKILIYSCFLEYCMNQMFLGFISFGFIYVTLSFFFKTSYNNILNKRDIIITGTHTIYNLYKKS